MLTNEYGETELAEVIKAMRQHNVTMDREGMIWSDDEKHLLKECFEQGGDTRKLAVQLHRTETAIWQQMGKMSERVRKRQEKDPECLCNQCEFPCDRHSKN